MVFSDISCGVSLFLYKKNIAIKFLPFKIIKNKTENVDLLN